MARYRFHCTNGSECVFDAKGTDIRVPSRLVDRAQQVAREVMRSLEDGADWSEWRVRCATSRVGRCCASRLGQRLKMRVLMAWVDLPRMRLRPGRGGAVRARRAAKLVPRH